MSQRIKNVDEEMLINLQVNVSIKSFSNHNGFMEEFLYSVDFVNYEVDSNDL